MAPSACLVTAPRHAGRPRISPPEEIANAAQHLLSQHISLPLDDLVRETARLFGYQRTGQRVEPAMRRGIALLLTRQMAREEGGMVIQPPQ